MARCPASAAQPKRPQKHHWTAEREGERPRVRRCAALKQPFRARKRAPRKTPFRYDSGDSALLLLLAEPRARSHRATGADSRTCGCLANVPGGGDSSRGLSAGLAQAISRIVSEAACRGLAALILRRFALLVALA